MAIVFPASPSVNETFTEGSITYKCVQTNPNKWIGLGVTPADRLVEGSNSLEINAGNELIWTGGDVGIGTSTISQQSGGRKVLALNGSTNCLMNFNHGNSLAGFLYGANDEFRMESAGTRPLIFRTDVGESFRLEADSGRILKGWGDTTFGGTGQASDIAIAGTSSNNGIQVLRYNTGFGAYGLTIGRSKNGTIGTHGQVLSGNDIGFVSFVASDGTNWRGCADIAANADGNITSTSAEGKLIFKTTKSGSTTSTQAMTIKANHNVEIHDGNLVFETAGTGIDFSANANAAGMTSELLDDYEEGTFEPTFRAASGNFDTVVYHPDTGGRYVKIGNYVWVTGCVRVAGATINIGSPSNSDTLCIGNLPFNNNARTNGDNADSHGVCRVPVWNGSQAPHFIQARQNVNFCNLYYMASLTGTSSTNNVSHLTNQSMVQFTFAYTSD